MLDYPKDWEKVKLSALVKNITTGKLDANHMVMNGKYRFYTCAKDYYYINNYAFDGEALLISGNGEYVGYVHYYEGKFNAYQRTYVLMDFSCNSIFLKYYLDYFLESQINSEMKDGNTPYIVKSTLEDFSVTIPPLPEQKAIAETLMTFDRHIENLEKLIDKKKMIRDGALEDLMTGKTRLDGFDGEWENKKLGEILGYTQPSDFIENNIEKKGKIPVLTAGKSFILGYSNDKSGVYRNLPTILFDDFTTDVRYITFPFKVKSSATKFLGLKTKNYNIKYVYYWLKNLNYIVQSHERHWISLFSNLDINIPPLKEQEAIASILTSMDEEIENLEKEKAKIEKIKAGAMDDLLTGRVRLI